MKLDGSNEKDIFTLEPLKFADYIALDARNEYIYWSDPGTTSFDAVASISRVDFAGTEAEVVLGPTVVTSPVGLAIDEFQRLLYWSDEAEDDSSQGVIRVFDFSTEETEELLSVEGSIRGLDVEVGLVDGNVFFVDQDMGTINRVDRTGASIQVLSDSAQSPRDVAIDEERKLVFFIDSASASNGIGRVDYSGAFPTQILFFFFLFPFFLSRFK
jgi:streptogramin lyase